jgi:hypothetical protein
LAGEDDFTPDEWMTMQRATIAAGVLVSLSEGGGQEDEMFAVQQALRGARMGHANRLVRELTATRFSTGLQANTTLAEYQGPALTAIRSATATIGSKAPGDLAAFRVFVVEVAEAAANAHKEGGFGGMGGIRVSAREQAAIDAIKQALGVG